MDRVLLKEQRRLRQRMEARTGPGLSRMSEITSHIFISTWELSENQQSLRDNGIRAILTLETRPKESSTLKRYRSMHIDHKQIEVEDSPRAPLLDTLDACYDFIHEHVAKQHSVLVHCMQGVSRSVAVVAAYYLRRLYMLSFKKSPRFTRDIVDSETFLLGIALDKVQESRPCALPNNGFLMQLLMYELRLKRPCRAAIQEELAAYVDRQRREKARELGEEVDYYQEEFSMDMDEYIDSLFGAAPEAPPSELPSDDLSELTSLVRRLRTI
jgi:hypothetical protein